MPLTRFSVAPALCLVLCLGLYLPSLALAATPTVQEASQALRKGHNNVALEKINAYLTVNPKDAQGRFLKGLILTELGRNADSIKVFTELTEDYPELPEPYNNLAVLYAAQADYERAKHSLEMAIRTHPSYATAHENLGDIYAKMASQAYDKAMQLDKSNVSAQTKLALIQDLFSPTPRAAAGPVNVAVTKPASPAAAAVAPVATAQTVPASEPAAPAVAAPVSTPATPAHVAQTPADKTTNPAAIPAPADAKKAVIAALQAWAAAWSAKDVAGYLASYDAEFKTPDGQDRAAWEALRQERISRAEFIRVQIDQIKVKLSDNHASVRVRQRYASNTYKGQDYKNLSLVNRDGTWKIVEER